MCDCGSHFDKMNTNITGLVDALKVGSPNPWETSEPMAFGGPAGSYQMRIPYVGIDCQFKCDFASAGNGGGTAIISSHQQQKTPGLAATDQGTAELAPIDGMVLSIPANQTIPVDSEWYQVRDSQGVLYLVITTTSALYVNLQFRQKRKAK